MSAPDIQTAAEAETSLPALLDRLERGEQITITRQGRAVARLVPAASAADRLSPQHELSEAQAAVDELFRLREQLAARGVGPFALEEIRSAIHEGRKY